jgi:hypothetical protein
MHVDSIAWGLFRPKHLLESMDSEILCNRSRKYIFYHLAKSMTNHRETFSAIVDLYLAICPAVVLYNLQINLIKKVALSVALALSSM